VAPSFARIFYRNAVNVGLIVLTCAEADRISEGDEVTVDPGAGTISNLTTGETYRTAPLPPFVAKIAEAGGILEYVRQYGWESTV
jgi:3-isopropylmalate/(R)-2-methylmalate dehydratase small subunit